MSSVLLMAQLCVYASTARKTDGLQFSDQVLSYFLTSYFLMPVPYHHYMHHLLLQ